MDIDAAGLSAEASYRLLTGLVVPRPIAWVTSLSPTGVLNLAPFSHFTFVSPKPPLLAISVGRKGEVYKDTARNILTSEEFVVHIANSTMTEQVHSSADEHPPEVSEAELLGLATQPSTRIATPRLAAPSVAMECRLRHCIEFGDTRSRLLVGEVLVFHVADPLMRDGKVDTRALDPIGRIAGPSYTTLGEIVTLAPIRQTPKS
jgi:flavin reductase (DIM6/NTAB) family NADH-FMN oxidoreductase RutF